MAQNRPSTVRPNFRQQSAARRAGAQGESQRAPACTAAFRARSRPRENSRLREWSAKRKYCPPRKPFFFLQILLSAQTTHVCWPMNLHVGLLQQVWQTLLGRRGMIEPNLTRLEKGHHPSKTISQYLFRRTLLLSPGQDHCHPIPGGRDCSGTRKRVGVSDQPPFGNTGVPHGRTPRFHAESQVKTGPRGGPP